MNWKALGITLAAQLCAGLASAEKLTQEARIELIRGLTAEHATAKSALPRSKKALVFESTGTWDRAEWESAGREHGPAARSGDMVQVTKVTLDDDKVTLEINGGFKGGRKWYQNVQVSSSVGMRGQGMGGSSAPGGTTIAVRFAKGVPEIKAVDLKKLLKPVLDFDPHSATENFVETLPPEIQKAIKDQKAIEGMDRETVLMALGRPRGKTRETKDGVELEDWIYGQPPGKITFVTFAGSKVTRVRDAYAGLGGSTAPPLEVK